MESTIHIVEHVSYNGWDRRCVNSPAPDPNLYWRFEYEPA